MGARVYVAGARVYAAGARVYAAGARVYASLVILVSALGPTSDLDSDLDQGLTIRLNIVMRALDAVSECPGVSILSLTP